MKKITSNPINYRLRGYFSSRSTTLESKNTVTVASENVSERNECRTKDTNKNDVDLLVSYTRNWPNRKCKYLSRKSRCRKTFKIAFLGSNALGEGEDSWPEMVKASLKDTFGEHIDRLYL